MMDTSKKIVYGFLVLLVLGGVALLFTRIPAVPDENMVVLPQACVLSSQSDITLYSRPSMLAGVFGVLASGETVEPTAITENGWYAFDPHSAQADNVGIFRNRYISPSSDVISSGDCSNLPKITALPADTCFTMAHMDTTVYGDTSEMHDIITGIIPSGGYAEVTAQHGEPGSEAHFIEVITSENILGWVHGDDIHFNGRCDELPQK